MRLLSDEEEEDYETEEVEEDESEDDEMDESEAFLKQLSSNLMEAGYKLHEIEQIDLVYYLELMAFRKEKREREQLLKAFF